MDKEKLLPLGSIVKLKNIKDYMMIIGLGVEVEGKKYDFCACLHPYGYLGQENLITFNSDQIENVVFLGYFDDESKDYYDDIVWLGEQNKEGE